MGSETGGILHIAKRVGHRFEITCGYDSPIKSRKLRGGIAMLEETEQDRARILEAISICRDILKGGTAEAIEVLHVAAVEPDQKTSENRG